MSAQGPSVKAHKATLVTALRDHFRTNENTGAIVVHTVAASDASTIHFSGVNISRSRMLAAAERLCAVIIRDMQDCACGADHGRRIAQLEQALMLLAADAPEGVVLQ